MNILVISILILLGLIFCLIELLVLPGITLGGILSAACYVGAIYMAFTNMGATGGVVVIVVSLALTLLSIAFSLRAKTWDRFSLKSKINSASSTAPSSTVKSGDLGVAISRLAPMGKVEIGGQIYEAKSSDVFIDAKSKVEVVGFENFSVVVKKIN